ncbi:hypothetical protein BC940DRAFT_172331 [Gongronella butleri]|nr:hypothetical protein BC940DRAFT_172331 [Gongronella butleri]
MFVASLFFFFFFDKKSSANSQAFWAHGASSPLKQFRNLPGALTIANSTWPGYTDSVFIVSNAILPISVLRLE